MTGVKKNFLKLTLDKSHFITECSTNRRKVMFVPLGFGEVGVKERVKKVMGYKKTKISITIFLILICGIIVICFKVWI